MLFRSADAAALQLELERFLAGAVAGEPVPPLSDEERRLLEALGYF